MLELSKLHVYAFHYNHVCEKYLHANQLRLLFTDTDSLAYAVQADGIYRDMVNDAASRYDFSEYPLDHETVKGVKRKVKDDHLHFAQNLDVLRSFKSYV